MRASFRNVILGVLASLALAIGFQNCSQTDSSSVQKQAGVTPLSLDDGKFSCFLTRNGETLATQKNFVLTTKDQQVGESATTTYYASLAVSPAGALVLTQAKADGSRKVVVTAPSSSSANTEHAAGLFDQKTGEALSCKMQNSAADAISPAHLTVSKVHCVFSRASQSMGSVSNIELTETPLQIVDTGSEKYSISSGSSPQATIAIHQIKSNGDLMIAVGTLSDNTQSAVIFFDKALTDVLACSRQ